MTGSRASFQGSPLPGSAKQSLWRIFVEAASKMLFVVVGTVMWAAPLGAFGAIAFTVGRFGAGSLLAPGKLLGGFYLTSLIFIFGVVGPVCASCGFGLIKLTLHPGRIADRACENFL